MGKDAIGALAIDGRGGKAEMLEKVARWVAAGGRNVTQPGKVQVAVHVAIIRLMLSLLVMVVSYETLRTLTAHLANAPIGLLICDEGHRLKNSGEPP